MYAQALTPLLIVLRIHQSLKLYFLLLAKITITTLKFFPFHLQHRIPQDSFGLMNHRPTSLWSLTKSMKLIIKSA